MAASFTRGDLLVRSTSPARAGQLGRSFSQSDLSARIRSSSLGSFSSTVTTTPRFAFSRAFKTLASSAQVDFGKRPSSDWSTPSASLFLFCLS